MAATHSTTQFEPEPLAVPESPGDALPLAFGQESLWLVEQMLPGSPIYNLPEAWILKGRVEIDALQRSLDEIVARHETLRTIFKSFNGKPRQVVLEWAQIKLRVVDLSGSDNAQAELRQHLEFEARRPFDLQTAPLARAILFHISKEEKVLLLNQHHLISDAWSQGVFIRELSLLYSAFVKGTPSALPPLPIQYADYALWQREMMGSQVGHDHLAYWQEKLHSPGHPVTLPGPRAGGRSYQGSTQFYIIPAAKVDSLKELSRREGVTLFMTLLATFKTLLHRYTQEKEIVVGTPMACRERVEVEALIGFFVHTQALRSDLSGDPTFVQLLRKTREVVLGAYAHQEVPCELAIKNLPGIRAAGSHPLFRVVFGWQNASPQKWTAPGLEAVKMELENGTAKFDWTLLVTECQDGLHLRSEFNTDLLDAETMVRLMRQFQILLESVVASPDSRISQLALTTAAEREELLALGNPASAEYERKKRIHEIFESQAAQTPNAVALVMGGQCLSYAELNQRANQLARLLAECGVEPNSKVGLCVQRSFEMVISILAILKAGATYVPINGDYPPERVAFMLEDCGIAVLITETGQLSGRGALGSVKRLIEIDQLQGRIAKESTENLHVEGSSSGVAYVMYTSGSTGNPKGALITHRAVVRLVRNTNYLEFSPDQVFLQSAPITFDASTFEIWGALLNGAKLVLLPPPIPTLDQLGRAIQDHGVTTLWLTAGLFHQMVDDQLHALRGVKQLLAGGDVLSPVDVSKALKELKGCQLINGYGPTENTTFTCCFRLPASWPEDQPVPIGTPIGNTRVYVLDENMNPVPIGMPGEIYADGDGLALGYLNQPQLTSDKFVRNPFTPDGQARLYRTGDLGRWLPDGNLQFLGRTDEQVKIRGHRVEPREIEQALLRHPAVVSTVVIAREVEFGGKQLIAYTSQRSGTTVNAAELRGFLEGKLPSYMVPSHFVIVNDLPLTVNGKVDRRALPDPDLENGRMTNCLVAPRTPEENTVASIWCELLHLDKVGIHEDFFHLGGDSLLAMQLISRMARAFKVELPLLSIFECPTVARLALAIETARSDQPACQLSAIGRSGQARAAELLDRLEEFSESELEEMLSDPELKAIMG